MRFNYLTFFFHFFRRLDENQITNIPTRSFAAYRRLVRLDLSKNPIYNIHEDAFQGLSSLQKLSLYSTELTTLPETIFSKHTRALQILLLHKNKLTCLPMKIFSNLTSLTTLSLFDNNLETITNAEILFFALKSLRLLHLAKNPWNCDCRLAGLIDYLKENDVEKSGAFCATPIQLLNIKLIDISKSQLVCQRRINDYQCGSSQICPRECQCKSTGEFDCSNQHLETTNFLNNESISYPAGDQTTRDD